MIRKHRVFRRFLVFLVCIGGLALAAQLSGLLSLFTRGSSAIERWTGEQLRLLADDLLRPELTFDEFDYEFPGTATFRNVRLTDGDDVVVEAVSLRVILRDIPRRGKPLVIEAVELIDPIVRLIVREDGTLAGFTNFVTPAGGQQRADGGSSRPSDVFAIRRLAVTNGAFRWTGADGTSMELDELEFELTGRPDEDPGWYELAANLTRAPAMELAASGRFQLDEGILDLREVSMDVTLDKTTIRQLPPAIQSVLSTYEVRGRLSISGNANVPFTDLDGSTFTLKVALSDAHIAAGDFQVPVERLETELRLIKERLTAESIDAQVFSGNLQGSATVDFDRDGFAEVAFSGKDILLERLLRESVELETDLSGAISLDGSLSATLGDLPRDLQGSGHVTVGNAHLMGEPVYGGLMRAVGRKKGGFDSGSTDFALRPDRVEFTRTKLIGGSTAARGEGEMMFDGRINFRFNAGPMERLQERLGPLGNVFGLVTDRIVTYHVTGTWSEPVFKTRPLGIGANAEKRDPPG